MKLRIIILLLLYCSLSNCQTIKVGSKHFNEGYILSEIVSILLEDNGYTIERNFNLGGTKVCFDALTNQAIDIYPEYTGTISEEILKLNRKVNIDELRTELQKNNLEISEPLGFNNTYALCIKKETADKYSIKTISQLKRHPEIRMALSYEFLKRKDGWENLKNYYGLSHIPVGIEHGLAYNALNDFSIDITDAYSTDGELSKYGLVTLEDDRKFFPIYDAVLFYRNDIDNRIREIINKLSHQINETEMRTMNSRSLFEKKEFYDIAFDFLYGKGLINNKTLIKNNNAFSEILSKTLTHLKLTFIALFLAIIIAVPLGILIYKYYNAARPVLYFAGLLQTIPSIALLALMIPLFGIGIIPAIIALFLYALLPILRNTSSGLISVDPLLKKVASGIGLNNWQKLKYVEIPLAIPSILAGIKTAAIINIGTATLAAFIGAGGLGEFIVTGLALNDMTLILMGAIPAALLAIIMELVFEFFERMLLPKHLKSFKVKD